MDSTAINDAGRIDCEIPRSWYVLHVKPRTEKKVALYMQRYRLWHYLPLYRKVTRKQRRKVVTMMPLFSGYMFASMNPNERNIILKTNLIVRTIKPERPRLLIHQLRQIAKASRNECGMRKTEIFKEGDRVRVSAGPFYGIEGYIKKDEGGSVIVLNVEILGQAVAVKISPSDCEKVD